MHLYLSYTDTLSPLCSLWWDGVAIKAEYVCVGGGHKKSLHFLVHISTAGSQQDSKIWVGFLLGKKNGANPVENRGRQRKSGGNGVDQYSWHWALSVPHNTQQL